MQSHRNISRVRRTFLADRMKKAEQEWRGIKYEKKSASIRYNKALTTHVLLGILNVERTFRSFRSLKQEGRRFYNKKKSTNERITHSAKISSKNQAEHKGALILFKSRYLAILYNLSVPLALFFTFCITFFFFVISFLLFFFSFFNSLLCFLLK